MWRGHLLDKQPQVAGPTTSVCFLSRQWHGEPTAMPSLQWIDLTPSSSDEIGGEPVRTWINASVMMHITCLMFQIDEPSNNTNDNKAHLFANLFRGIFQLLLQHCPRSAQGWQLVRLRTSTGWGGGRCCFIRHGCVAEKYCRVVLLQSGCGESSQL